MKTIIPQSFDMGLPQSGMQIDHAVTGRALIRHDIVSFPRLPLAKASHEAPSRLMGQEGIQFHQESGQPKGSRHECMILLQMYNPSSYRKGE